MQKEVLENGSYTKIDGERLTLSFHNFTLLFVVVPLVNVMCECVLNIAVEGHFKKALNFEFLHWVVACGAIRKPLCVKHAVCCSVSFCSWHIVVSLVGFCIAASLTLCVKHASLCIDATFLVII